MRRPAVTPGGPARVAAAAVVLAVVTSLAACSDGGDATGASGAPEEASVEEFCDAFNGLFDEVLSQAAAGDSGAMVSALKDWAADIEEVGTPADMPDEARNGFELFVEQASSIEEDADLADLAQLGEGLDESDQADGLAFSEWTQDNCPLDLPELPGSTK